MTRSMPAVRLGKLHLKWCDICNLPILEMDECGICGNRTHEVSITPPGDIRPAFDFDLNVIRETINEQFGGDCADSLIPDNKIILLNKAPYIDKMDEVIVDGKVIGSLKYDIEKGYRFLLRIDAVPYISEKFKKNWIRVDRGAVAPIFKGANVLACGIVDANKDIKIGDEVIVLNEDHYPIAFGSARMCGKDMLKEKRGLAVKTRKSGIAKGDILKGGQKWDDVLKANKNIMRKRTDSAKKFICRVIEKNDLPVAVSFSGGKDSLATLLLVLEAGFKPKLIFINTGIEFDETVKHVYDIAEKYDLELIVEEVIDSFWKNVDYFGPPAKDFRWCCKTCKLGPIVKLIEKNFLNGVLSFIGQRKYESQQRSKKGQIWSNPWVPGQLGASPIQHWTSLHVWLYIFSKGVEYNKLYERGFERIGCWLCPASDIAELDLVKKHHEQYEKWNDFLLDYAKKRGGGEKWVEFGLWRWKKPPKDLLLMAKKEGAIINDKKEEGLKFLPTYLSSNGVEMKGNFTQNLNIERVGNLMNAVGKVEIDGKKQFCTLHLRSSGQVTIFKNGNVVIKGNNKEEVEILVRKLERIVVRAMDCVGCGVCIGRCKQHAISINEKDNRAWIDEEKCIHCQACLGPCVVVDFSPYS